MPEPDTTPPTRRRPLPPPPGVTIDDLRHLRGDVMSAEDAEIEAADAREDRRTGGTFALKYLGAAGLPPLTPGAGPALADALTRLSRVEQDPTRHPLRRKEPLMADTPNADSPRECGKPFRATWLGPTMYCTRLPHPAGEQHEALGSGPLPDGSERNLRAQQSHDASVFAAFFDQPDPAQVRMDDARMDRISRALNLQPQQSPEQSPATGSHPSTGCSERPLVTEQPATSEQPVVTEQAAVTEQPLVTRPEVADAPDTIDKWERYRAELLREARDNRPDDPPHIHRADLRAALDHIAITDPDNIMAIHIVGGAGLTGSVIVTRMHPGAGPEGGVLFTTTRIEIR